MHHYTTDVICLFLRTKFQMVTLISSIFIIFFQKLAMKSLFNFSILDFFCINALGFFLSVSESHGFSFLDYPKILVVWFTNIMYYIYSTVPYFMDFHLYYRLHKWYSSAQVDVIILMYIWICLVLSYNIRPQIRCAVS